jgi:hypothetical protein
MRGIFVDDSIPSELVSDVSQKCAFSIRCLADHFRFKFSCFNEWQKFREFQMFDGLTRRLSSLFEGQPWDLCEGKVSWRQLQLQLQLHPLIRTIRRFLCLVQNSKKIVAANFSTLSC